jgi:hypothetical protein
MWWNSADGTVDNYYANVIAENMFAQVDAEDKQYMLMHEITDHRADDSALRVTDGFVISRNGNRVLTKTTCGWELLVLWRDGSSQWIKLKDIKDSYPVQVAEYAVAEARSQQNLRSQLVGTQYTTYTKSYCVQGEDQILEN